MMYTRMHSLKTKTQRGFTLLIAVILTSVILSVGLALLDISVKQVTLATVSRQSEYAFYNADSALECALYYDAQNTFNYTTETSGTLAECAGQASVAYTASAASGGTRTTTFSIPCTGGGSSANVTILKQSSGTTNFFANGYDTCSATDPKRVERGEEAHYQ